MADEQELIAERQRKADELREAGLNPYANDFRPDTAVASLLQRWPEAPETETPTEKGAPPALLVEDRFALAGRIVALRSFGKAAFVKLRDRTGEIQVWFRKDIVGEAEFAVFKKMERGDFIGVNGGVLFTRTGELTVLAESFKTLTKSIRPLPEKFHGLSDVEVRYRQRYVDLICNSDVREVFRKRSAILRHIRRFFDDRDFLEVETLTLHRVVGGAAAKPFRTHHNALDLDINMRIAPELFLKRLVVGGFERVYEIGRNYRNEGLSRRHNPEFTMLEFYQAYATYEDLISLTESLFVELAEDVCGSRTVQWEDVHIDLTPPWPRIAMKDAIVTGAKTGRLPTGLERPMLDDPLALKSWLEKHELHEKKDDLGAVLRKAESHGERVGALFDHAGEMTLPGDRPTFVVEYLFETSPLSRRNDGDPSNVDRFELFIAGREVANAFSELNDPVDQRNRFKLQVDAKARGQDETMEYDEDYCRALWSTACRQRQGRASASTGW